MCSESDEFGFQFSTGATRIGKVRIKSSPATTFAVAIETLQNYFHFQGNGFKSFLNADTTEL